MRRFFLVVLLIGVLLSAAALAQAASVEKVLIRTSKPYANVVAAVEALGGRVTYQYKYLDAVAAEVPSGALGTLRGLVGPAAISKDLEVPAPASRDLLREVADATRTVAVTYDSVEGIAAADLPAFAQANPGGYIVNNAILNVSALHGAGFDGLGIVVGVIDSGIRPGFPHISLDGSVIGCEDFVGDANGCSHSGNSGHGTFVAGMISANVVFTFSTTSGTRNAILQYCPACFLNPPTNTQVPMLGSAPLSSIYALRVFGPTGGAPTSRILAAMERAIELRDLYEAGDPSGVKIQVVNMSLGGSTLFPGRDLFDQAVNLFLDHDIVAVVAAGNQGPSSLTTASPGSSFGTITVGAASLAHNERILRHLQLPASLGANRGALYRPFSGTQMSYFSSRGPNADGRIDPDVVSNGFANFGQGYFNTNNITISSGTSFSTPSVSGVAAVLRQAFPSATATQVRNAIISAANPNVLADGSANIDQGNGYVDALAAANLLASGSVPNSLPAPGSFTKSVKVNVEQGTILRVRDGFVVETARNLLPGQRHDILYRVAPNTRRVVVQLFNVTPALPPAQQNQLFGDDILLTVHSAKTSAIGSSGDYLVFTFTTGGAFALDNPETGLLRVTVNGDWTNAGTISANVGIFSLTDSTSQMSSSGFLSQGQQAVFPVQIPAGVEEAQFRLIWREDWGNYPLSDLDFYVFDPSLNAVASGASLDDPELATVEDPVAGTWFVLLDGFEVHVNQDKFELRVTADGRVLR